MQARDAYDRARRAIENKEKDAAKGAKVAPPATGSTPGTGVAVAPVPTASTLPTLTLRPIPTEPVPPPSTPAPTVVALQTPPPPPTGTAPGGEVHQFATGNTRAAAAPGAKQDKSGFGVALVEFSGRFEFEVTPSPLVPGSPFRVRIFLRNDGKRDAKLDTLTVKILRNGEVTSPEARILEDDVKVGQRPMIAEIPGTWVAGTRAWVMDVQVISKKGERFNCALTMKP